MKLEGQIVTDSGDYLARLLTFWMGHGSYKFGSLELTISC